MPSVDDPYIGHENKGAVLFLYCNAEHVSYCLRRVMGLMGNTGWGHSLNPIKSKTELLILPLTLISSIQDPS